MNTSATDLFRRFRGHETTVAALARHMLRSGLTPADVLAAHERWLAERMAEMVPVGGSKRELGSVKPSNFNLQTSHSKQRHRAGDFAQLPDACPRCGATVEMLQLCHIESPTWRTQLACMADGCVWHGKSRLPIDALQARGAANLANNVTEG